MAKVKYSEELKNRVKEILISDKKISISGAIRKACEEVDIDYTDSARVSISRSLRSSEFVRDSKAEYNRLFKEARKKTYDEDKKVFIITWAQNATPVHENFFKNILAYQEFKDANLHVIAGRYKNPTSIWSENNLSNEYWVKEVQPFLDARQHNIHKYLQVRSDIKIPPTRSMPLSRLNGVSGLESCIVGHPRVHLKSLPILEGYPHKLLLSTGACTIANYTDSGAGKVGEFHHTLGFTIVELEEDFFHVRQVTADAEGNFYDFFHRVEDQKVTLNTEGIAAAILGDVHTRHNNKEITEKVFKILDVLKPDHTIVHDIAEMESILHWDERNPFRLLQKEELEQDNLREEIEEILEWFENHKQYNLIMARSNHDDMLDRWLQSADWRKTKNKKIYLELANILANEPVAQDKGVLPFLVERRFGDEVKTLSLDDSFRVLSWELSLHGHLGANGSRGNHGQFKNLNTKNITGHGHHPHREDGHAMVGTLSHLRVGFNRGASSWMNGFGILHRDDKFQHINFIKGNCYSDLEAIFKQYKQLK